MAKDQAAQAKSDKEYLDQYKGKIAGISAGMAAGKNSTLTVPPLPELPEKTHYEKILNSNNITDPNYNAMKKELGFTAPAGDGKAAGPKDGAKAAPAAAAPAAEAKVAATAKPAAPAKAAAPAK